MLVAPSILSANFLRLEEEIKSICEAGADFIHIDIMDGHFVPNLTFGPVVLKGVKEVATKPLDIHLMVENLPFFIDLFAPLKPKYMSVHIEETKHLHRIIQQIRDYDISPAVVLNPHTSEETLRYIIQDIDMVLLMSVNPGFGGQEFIPSVLEKAKRLKELIYNKNPDCLIEVDGGVSNKNILDLKQCGVDIVVAGSYIFSQKDYTKAISSLR
ncbi:MULTISPECIES: ribulose-phosphate 3-epimerase [unclassified Helicobacter]|uniref:ribulose-phosphate 3-epimerase n=1 Tax=unclassified Helicobacter TaxID=2593540 RepID=UPI000CF0C9E6|nr:MULTISPECIES: ribulose-phosphate 3-epimerase [unclassified Helicobacter]